MFDALFFREAFFPSAMKATINASNKSVLKNLNFELLRWMLYFSADLFSLLPWRTQKSIKRVCSKKYLISNGCIRCFIFSRSSFPFCHEGHNKCIKQVRSKKYWISNNCVWCFFFADGALFPSAMKDTKIQQTSVFQKIFNFEQQRSILYFSVKLLSLLLWRPQ